jgi:hypothetical protein
MAREKLPYPTDVLPEYRKTESYGPAQFNHRKSTGGPEKSWGRGSYDKNGRACETTEENAAPGYGAGGHSGAGNK